MYYDYNNDGTINLKNSIIRDVNEETLLNAILSSKDFQEFKYDNVNKISSGILCEDGDGSFIFILTEDKAYLYVNGNNDLIY